MSIINQIKSIVEKEHLPIVINEERILLAAGMALYHHRGSKRKSGEPYFIHPIGLAKILIRRLSCPDEDMYIAAFLHDLKEDTSVTLDDIGSFFGEEVRFLVDGLTKLEKAAEERNVEKFVYYLKKDIRILLLKAVDRGHNLLTSRFLTEESRERNAKEALDLYVPLCVLAGFMKAARQLSDVAYKILEPKKHERISKLIKGVEQENSQLIGELQESIRNAFEERETKKFKIRRLLQGKEINPERLELLKSKSIRFFTRPKTPYELAKQFALRGTDVFRFSDVIMMQIIVDDEEDCAYVYNLIHSLGELPNGRKKVRPLNKYHRDFVHDPKLNLYQSLHTAIEVGGIIVRFQIRTQAMQEIAEKGVISKSYKKGKFQNPRLPWLDSAYLEEFMNPERSLVEKLRALRSLQSSRYASVRISNSSLCQLQEIPLPTGISPIEVAFILAPEAAFKLSGAEVNGIPYDIFKVSDDRISLIDLYVGNEEIYMDYLELLKDIVAKKRLVDYLKSLTFVKQIKYSEGALSFWLNRNSLTLNDIRVFDKYLKRNGFRGLRQALKDIGNGSVSAYEIFKEILVANVSAPHSRKLIKIEYYIDNWPEENFTAFTTPLRAICGDIEKITIKKTKEGSRILVTVSIPVKTRLAFGQIENFVRSLKEKYAPYIKGVIIKKRKRIIDPFYGFEVLDEKNPYHDFIKAEAIRELSKDEESFYVLNITEEDIEPLIEGQKLAWAQFIYDIREAKVVFLRIPRRKTYKYYQKLKAKLNELGIKVIYIYSDGRYSDVERTNQFIKQLLGPRNVIYIDVNEQKISEIFH